MNVHKAFFNDIEALAKLYADEAETVKRKKKAIVVRKLPMLPPVDCEHLNTILICPHPGERVLIMRETEFGKRKGNGHKKFR
ncbi:MAG: hypothetical protein GQ523_05355 [Methanophagales archaeon]|jgi:hypothetical protein|nr:hypothetical protein [Methanophagales archaeon]